MLTLDSNTIGTTRILFSILFNTRVCSLFSFPFFVDILRHWLPFFFGMPGFLFSIIIFIIGFEKLFKFTSSGRKKFHSPGKQFVKIQMILSPPKDKFKLVFLVFVLHGVGVLMPWNMFITAKSVMLIKARRK
ncbi:hypothetical protein GQX74_014531 [Glossina fuscipes]|nr:hypothetical protein GQX74_014531 [Glossina fuscipes]